MTGTPDKSLALAHVECLTGGAGTPVRIRLIPDADKSRPTRKLFGALEQLWPEIETAQANGYGVFVVANEGGDTDAEITATRACFVDADNVPLPDHFHLQPDFIVRRDPTHWHAYWRVSDLPTSRFTEAQKRLAARYGTDTAVCNPSRVMRLAGTMHQKAGKQPSLVELSVVSDDLTRLLGHSTEELLAGLPAVASEADEGPSQHRGEPVDARTLREALSYLDPDVHYPEWRDIVAAVGAANCAESEGIAHEWSEGRLDRLKRYEDAHPSRHDGPDAVEQVLSTMPPKVGGIGPGSIAKLAADAGWQGTLAPRQSAQEIFGPLLRSIAAEEKPATDAKWQFDLCDPVADATAPPIDYRDEHKLWPNSRERIVTQIIAGAKCHKTNWMMAEHFRLMQNASARVLILALEGAYGVRTARLKALAEYYSAPLLELRGRFQVAKVSTGGIFDLSDPECVIAFASWVKGRWSDVVIDTQHRAAGGLEENSATDARILWNAVEVIRRHGDCNVTLLHHTGKDTTRGGRGSSADLASVDQQIELTFDRPSMTVSAKVTARKDGPDGFTVPFKVYQPTPNVVPILLPITTAEFETLTARKDRVSPEMLGSALREMQAVGRAKGVTTHAMAFQVLASLDELPTDPEAAEKAVHSLGNRILERAAKDTRIAAYGRKDGGHRTAPWVWYLPEGDREELSDV